MSRQGAIVEENLQYNRLINGFMINKFRISKAEKPEDRWHLYEVEATPAQIDKLTTQLKPIGWYTHFWQANDVIVMFPGKKFEIKYSNQETIAYGKTQGFPVEQLDFKVDE